MTKCKNKDSCNAKPLSASSKRRSQNSNTKYIKDHPCAKHCYDFECNLDDSCGDVDGVPGNNADIQFGINGVQNLDKYLGLNGDNEKQVCVDSINVNALGFAISLWFKTDNFNQDARFFSKAINNFIQGHIVSAQLSNNKLKFRLKLGNDISDGTTQWQTTGNPITSDVWYHVVFWYDGCDVKIYLDGVEQSIEETQNGNTNNTSRPFANFKGCPVYQGDEESAIGSQPVNPNQQFPGYRAYDGCMDQLIIWNFPISEDLINELYNSGDGSKEVTVKKYVSDAKLSNCKNCLTTFKQIVCIKTCFKSDLCDILAEGCGKIRLELVTCKNRSVCVLVDIKSLNEWPGDFELLEIKKTDDVFCYVIRLKLCTDKLYTGGVCSTRRKVRLTIGEGNYIEKPLKPFVITGFKC